MKFFREFETVSLPVARLRAPPKRGRELLVKTKWIQGMRQWFYRIFILISIHQPVHQKSPYQRWWQVALVPHFCSSSARNISSRDAYMLIYVRRSERNQTTDTETPAPPEEALSVIHSLNNKHEEDCREYVQKWGHTLDECPLSFEPIISQGRSYQGTVHVCPQADLGYMSIMESNICVRRESTYSDKNLWLICLRIVSLWARNFYKTG